MRFGVLAAVEEGRVVHPHLKVREDALALVEPVAHEMVEGALVEDAVVVPPLMAPVPLAHQLRAVHDLAKPGFVREFAEVEEVQVEIRVEEYRRVARAGQM